MTATEPTTCVCTPDPIAAPPAYCFCGAGTEPEPTTTTVEIAAWSVEVGDRVVHDLGMGRSFYEEPAQPFTVTHRIIDVTGGAKRYRITGTDDAGRDVRMCLPGLATVHLYQ